MPRESSASEGHWQGWKPLLGQAGACQRINLEYMLVGVGFVNIQWVGELVCIMSTSPVQWLRERERDQIVSSGICESWQPDSQLRLPDTIRTLFGWQSVLFLSFSLLQFGLVEGDDFRDIWFVRHVCRGS